MITPKTPKIHMLVTAANKATVDGPHFGQCLENWGTIAARAVCVVPDGLAVPKVKGVRFVRCSGSEASLADVLHVATEGVDVVHPTVTIADSACVFQYGITEAYKIATARQLQTSWVATAHPVRLMDFDKPLAVDDSMLAFFMAPAGIWQFLYSRLRPVNVPFRQPVWSGWLAHWCSQHIHMHKYHDMTPFRAIGRFEESEPLIEDTKGFGPLTFNAPTKTYYKPA